VKPGAAQRRGDVERFAFAAGLRFPDLVEESGVQPEHFATGPLADGWGALPKVTMRTPDNRVPVMHVATASGVAVETLARATAAEVYTPEQARTWWGELLDLASADALEHDVRALFAGERPEADVTGNLLARLEQVLREYSDHAVEHEVEDAEGIASSFVDERLEEIRTGRRRGVETGLEILDSWMGGLNSGELTTVVAGGGVGKSTFALDVARRVAERGAKVLYFSAEMTRRQMGQREAYGAIGRAISDPRVDPVEIASARDVVAEAPHRDRVFFDFRTRLSAPQVLARAKRVQHRFGLGLVVFDHLGCWDCERPRANEQEQVAATIQQAKDVAKALDAPFVMITHLNRQGQIRASERVKDISDNVLELKREERARHTEGRLLKARQTGEIFRTMLFEYRLQWQRFVEVSAQSEERSYEAPRRAAGAENDVPF